MTVTKTAASAAKKTAAPRKTAAAKHPTLVFESNDITATKNTFRCNEDGEREDHVSGAIYLQKSQLGDIVPTHVRVTVEILGQA